MHAIEKILAKHSGRDRVVSGEIITADIDFAEINDLYLQTIYSFREMGGEKVWDRDKAAFVFDHYAPSPTIEASRNHREMRWNRHWGHRYGHGPDNRKTLVQGAGNYTDTPGRHAGKPCASKGRDFVYHRENEGGRGSV